VTKARQMTRAIQYNAEGRQKMRQTFQLGKLWQASIKFLYDVTHVQLQRVNTNIGDILA